MEFLTRFTINENDFIKVPDELLIQTLENETGWSFVEAVYLTKKVLENDLFSLVKDIA